MIPNQQNFTRHDERFNFSIQPSSRAAKSGKFALPSRAIKHCGFNLEVLSLQSRKSFEYFFCTHRTLGISPIDLEGFKADIAFISTRRSLACSLKFWLLKREILLARALPDARFDWLVGKSIV